MGTSSVVHLPDRSLVMPTEPPPSYETALTQPPNQAAARPGVSVTSPQGQTRSASSDQAAGTAPLARTTANESLASVSTDGGLGAEDLIGEEGRRSLDDERRDLPEGWVRCFDAKWVGRSGMGSEFGHERAVRS